MKSFLPLAALIVALTGCMSAPEPAQLYVLPPPSFQKPAWVMPKPVTIKIALPEVASGLDTTRIAVLENGYKLDYIAQASWPEPLPYMMQMRLVDGFQKSGVVRGVSSDASGVQSDYIVQLEVQEFNAIKDTGPAPFRVRIRYRALLLASDSHTLVTAVPATQEVAATANSMQGIIEAFTAADAAAMQTILPALITSIPSKR